MLLPVRIEPRPFITSDSKSNTILSELVRHVLAEEIFQLLLMYHFIFDLVRINRVWLYKQPKVSILQANAKLVQYNANIGIFV